MAIGVFGSAYTNDFPQFSAESELPLAEIQSAVNLTESILLSLSLPSVSLSLDATSWQAMKEQSYYLSDSDNDEEDEMTCLVEQAWMKILRSVLHVDRIWFDNYMWAYCRANRKYSLNIIENFQSLLGNEFALTLVPSLLEAFCACSLVQQLVSELPFEDERFDSPKAGLVKAMYLSVPHSRAHILSGLSEMSRLRVCRCVGADSVALQHELCVNSVASKGLLDHTNAFQYYSSQSCASIPVMDSDKSVTASLVNSCSAASVIPGSTEERCATTVLDSDCCTVEVLRFVVKFERLALMHGDGQDSSFYSHWNVVLSVIVNVFRCYGSRLSRKGESSEQPFVLNGILKVLHKFLMLQHCVLRRTSDCDARRLFSTLARQLCSSWPKGNYIRELAYVRAAEVLLSTVDDATVTDIAQLTKSKCGTSCCSTDQTEVLTSLLKLNVTNSTIGALRKCFLCVLSSASSYHFKVANAAICVLVKNPRVLFRWILRKDDSDCESDDDGSAVASSLVEILRDNRTNHWNPQVQKLSSESLGELVSAMYA